jgi:UDP-N-acetyl-D-glucosamine dehydrogenase
MPRFVVEKITEALNRNTRSVRGARVHVLGVAYKAGVNDVRESPALTVMKLLAEKGAVLSYTDPYVPAVREEGLSMDSLPLTNGSLQHVDCAVVLTDHREVDYDAVLEAVPVLVDTRNALRGRRSEKIIRL